MNSRIRAKMASQHGLITRRQALQLGMSEDRIDRLVRTGTWALAHTGVYCEAAFAARFTSHREQRLLADRAASLRIRAPHVMSHHSAAYELDLAVLREPVPITHVTRPGLVGTHHEAKIQHHLAPYAESSVVERNGIRCLPAARTALDIAREHGYLQGLVAADSAYRIGARPTDFAAAISLMKYWPHVTTARDVIASASPDADSVGETLARDLVTNLGFGEPEVQFGLTSDGRTAWCDLRLHRHVFEFNGRAKYQRVDEGGFTSSDPGEVLWFEKRRQDFLCGFKLGMSRLTWDDVLGPRRAHTSEWLLREYLDTCRRFGTDVSDLARFRPRGPRPKPQVRAARAA
jgi:hypothetical protein